MARYLDTGGLVAREEEGTGNILIQERGGAYPTIIQHADIPDLIRFLQKKRKLTGGYATRRANHHSQCEFPQNLEVWCVPECPLRLEVEELANG